MTPIDLDNPPEAVLKVLSKGKGGEGKASKKKKGESKGGGKAAAQGGVGDDDYAYAKVLIEELRPIYERLPAPSSGATSSSGS